MENKETEIQTEEKITFTKAELAAAGVPVEKLADIQVTAKYLAEKKANDETMANALVKLEEISKNFSEAHTALAEEKRATRESEKYDEVTSELIGRNIKKLASEKPEEAVSLINALSKEFGATNTSIALSGNLKSILDRPISKNHSQYEETMNFKQAFDDAYIITAKWGGVSQGRVGTDTTEIDWKVFQKAAAALARQNRPGASEVLKAVSASLNDTNANQGAEWIPTSLSSDLIEKIYLSLEIANRFGRKYMPTPVYNLPMLTGRGLAFGVPEALSPTDFYTLKVGASIFDTDKTTLTAQKIGAMLVASYEIEEDSLIDVANEMRKEVTRVIARGIDDAAMNGDKSAALDGTLWTGTTDVRSKFNGIRKNTNTAAKTDISTLNIAALRTLRKTMKVYGVDPKKLNLHCSTEGYSYLLGFPEVLTMEKFGPDATVKTGELARIDNISIFPSEFIYSNLNASGVYDGTTTTKTIMTLTHEDGFVFGDRQILRVETDRSVTSQQDLVVATWRGDFIKVQKSTENVSAIGYNLAT